MTVFLSPARRFRAPRPDFPAPARPRHAEKTARLAEALRASAPWELESLLGTSPALGLAASAAYADFSLEAPGIPALYAYRGRAFDAFAPDTLAAEDAAYAHRKLRIFSALYGPLRALDGIQPYRLELGGRFRIDGQTLYRFWGDAFYRDLFAEGGPALNLASLEYAKAVLPFLSERDLLVTCVFQVMHRGRYRVMATPAKEARGAMARFVVRNRVADPRELRHFDEGGFRFVPALSDARRLVFNRMN